MKTPIFESTICGRCGGSGKYSFNMVDGNRCYGCGGTGYKLTRRGFAAAAYFDSLASKPTTQLVLGDKVFYRGFTAGSVTVPSAWHTVESVTIEGDAATVVTRQCTYKTKPDAIWRIAQTKEQKAQKIKQALEYQATLTKSGKP